MTSDRYRCFDVTAVALGRNRILVRSNRTRRSRLLSPHAAQQLLSRTDFASIAEHAAALAGIPSAGRFAPEKALFEEKLMTFVSDGFLTSERELLADVASRAATHHRAPRDDHRIEAVGIPTRNRPDLMRRTLAGFLRACATAGRKPVFVVADDSHEDARRLNAASIRSTHGPFETIHLEGTLRGQFVRDLAHYAGVPLEIACFGLTGECESTPDSSDLDRHSTFNPLGTTYGANRNAILLAAAGVPCLMVDDDVVCESVAVPESLDGLALSSAIDPNEYWFPEDAGTSSRAEDVIALHERLLGRRMSDRIMESARDDESILVDEASPELLDVIPDATVALTFVGTTGDAGIQCNDARLFLRGASFGRLTARGYRRNMRTRRVLRAPLRWTLSNGLFCQSTNVGLDNRALLPPFVPSGRNEDGVFGGVLRTCFPEKMRGFAPDRALVHDPVEGRPAFPDPVVFTGLRANDVLMTLILARQRLRAAGEDALRGLARHLIELGSLPASMFEDAVRSVCLETVAGQAAYAEHLLDERLGVVQEAADDLEHFTRSVGEELLREDWYLPVDLDAEDVLSALRAHVRAYGLLLEHWPALMSCAASLRAEGYWDRANGARPVSTVYDTGRTAATAGSPPDAVKKTTVDSPSHAVSKTTADSPSHAVSKTTSDSPSHAVNETTADSRPQPINQIEEVRHEIVNV